MKRLKLVPLLMFLLVVASSCSTVGVKLNRVILKDRTVMPGTYTLILYGARHSEDLETLALLDYEGDGFSFEPFAREYDFTTKMHVGNGDVLEMATEFIHWYPSYTGSRLSKITDEKGSILGYELRPLYRAMSTYGYSDVLQVSYLLTDKKVSVYISLKRAVERAIEGNGDERGERIK